VPVQNLLHDLLWRSEICTAVAHEFIGKALLQRRFLLRYKRLAGIEVNARSTLVGEVERIHHRPTRHAHGLFLLSATNVSRMIAARSPSGRSLPVVSRSVSR
jgi:hypothetical protein